MKLYSNPMSRGVTVHWLMAELEIECEQIVIDFLAGENSTPEYRAINPMAKIPALVDDDIVVTEVAAICTYLADKFPEKGLAPSLDSRERGRYYRYLFFTGSTLEPMLSFNQLDITDYPVQSVGWGDWDRCMAAVESLVPENDWALGSTFTNADIVFGGTLDSAVQFGLIKSPTQKVANYVQRIKGRPAYRKTHGEA